MTQPIKFRGFRVDGKGWVEGFYFFNGTDHGIVHNTGFPGMWTAIHPSSLGMFTGRTDKNGREIYGAIGEKGGDVIRVYYQMNDMGWVHDLTHDTHISFQEGSFLFNDIDKHARPIHKLDMNFVQVIGNQFEGIREDKKNFVDIYKALEMRDKFEKDNGK